ncbi:hypothetical protein CU103_12390 [Phyllobacterium sophorae]|uniref:Uncharacterized protein n=1 Tax=Phyllobacterium sophorae TaxID=1520277 RepID=A0A2P7BE17_9HYPH|nr:hypothetical protein CU103_12390 [Phyllobacterium sophorae]
MTKKHYIAVSDVFRDEMKYLRTFLDRNGNDIAKDHLENVAVQLAIFFKKDNPRFNRERFMTACGF